MENKTQWKLPSEVAHTEWVKDNTGVFLVASEAEREHQLRRSWVNRATKAESDLTAALDFLKKVIDTAPPSKVGKEAFDFLTPFKPTT